MPEQDPLAQLRDIHLPAAISAWPLAIGWWVVIALVFIAIVVASYFFIKRHRNNRYRRLALAQLNALPHTTELSLYLQQINQLLKQTALAANTSYNIAGLTGQQWLQFLDRSGGYDDFCQGKGKILLTGPYAPIDSRNNQAIPTTQELETIARRWIKRHNFKSTEAMPC